MLTPSTTVGTLVGFIVEPIDVLTMGGTTEDIILTPIEDIIPTPTGGITVRPISEDGTRAYRRAYYGGYYGGYYPYAYRGYYPYSYGGYYRPSYFGRWH